MKKGIKEEATRSSTNHDDASNKNTEDVIKSVNRSVRPVANLARRNKCRKMKSPKVKMMCRIDVREEKRDTKHN